ncbi:MAG: CHASE2 domain-containing protein [Proteobacteria bacterium]|nr:CHASE2 domain-containing protein [Pseudomonadota bacterium]
MRRLLAGFALAALACAGVEIFILHALQPLENRLLDAFVRAHAARLAPDPAIVIVDIDEKSLAAMQKDAGRFPWPREVYADLVLGLAAQKPRAIVFDLMFSEPDRFRPESHRAFVEAVAPLSNVFFPMLRLDRRDDPNGVSAAELGPLLGLVRRPGADPDTRIAVVPPLALPSELWRGGPINFVEDPDHVGRGKRQRPQDEFAGKIVVVGAAAPGLGDLRVTPLSNTQPGVEILATAIENLKNGRAMRYSGDWAPAAAAFLLIALLTAAFLRNLNAGRIAVGLGAASAALLAASWFAAGRLLLLPLLAPLGAAWLLYFAAAIAAYLKERRAREEAIAMFSRFVNPHVVRQLMERGGLEGGGRTREVTLLFSDIRGFTTLSETRAPAR